MTQIKKPRWLSTTLSILGLSLFSQALALPNPAATLCASSGYTIKDGNCLFPDGSMCDQWAFWKGECGKRYHICTLHEGSIQTLEKSQTPICNIDGKLFTWTLSNQIDDDKWSVQLKPLNQEDSLENTPSSQGD